MFHNHDESLLVLAQIYREVEEQVRAEQQDDLEIEAMIRETKRTKKLHKAIEQSEAAAAIAYALGYKLHGGDA
jgi:hypothetical protein